MNDDPRMRFRLWVAAELADERWVDASNPEAEHHIDAVQQRHMLLVEAAVNEGRPWLIEVYDPEQPEDAAYFRFGSDEDGMVDPGPL